MAELIQPQAKQRLVLSCPYQEILYGGAAGSGKEVSVNEMMHLRRGLVPAGQVRVGDYLVGPDGGPTRVLGVSEPKLSEFFRVVFDDGCALDVSGTHRWTVVDHSKRAPGAKERGTLLRTMTTAEMMEEGLRYRDQSRFSIQLVSAPVDLGVHVKPEIPPYAFGYWLGNGYNQGTTMTCHTEDTEEVCGLLGESMGQTLGYRVYDATAKRATILTGGWRKRLRAAGVDCHDVKSTGGNTHTVFHKDQATAVVRWRLWSPENRALLLAGLLDSDGHANRRGDLEFDCTVPEITELVRSLLVSLGMKPSRVRVKSPGAIGNNKLDVHRVCCTPTRQVFRLGRKAERIRLRPLLKNRRYIDRIEPVGEKVGVCFVVDNPQHLYAAGMDYIVTHNSYLLILDWLAHWTKHGAMSSGVLFRNTFSELQEIRREMERIFDPVGAKFKEKDMAWTFPNAATLRLSYLDSYEDALKHKGNQWTWRGHDELTQRPSSDEYDYLKSRMRSASGIPIRIVSATNPDGPGHLWVKRHWQIDKYPNGLHPIHTYTNVKTGVLMGEHSGFDKLADDQLPDGVRRHTRIFIPGKLEDNIFLHADGNYRATLLALPEHQRKMLLDGSWDVVEGAFFTEWNAKHHVVAQFTPPKEWKRWMAGDWGSTAPYVFGWFAQAPNGEIYMYRELAGCQPGKLNEGVRESPATVAEKIRHMEQEADEWITERYLDSSCFIAQDAGQSIADQFQKQRVVFQPANRKNKAGAIALLRDYLKVVNGICRLHVMTNCAYTIQTIPLLRVDRHDMEQYDSKGPDHAADLLCYAMRRNIRTQQEMANERGLSFRNQRVLRRMGAYGAR